MVPLRNFQIVVKTFQYYMTSPPFLGPGSLHLKSSIFRFINQYFAGYKLHIVFSTPKCASQFSPLRTPSLHYDSCSGRIHCTNQKLQIV